MNKSIKTQPVSGLHGSDGEAERAGTRGPLRTMTITLTDAEMVAMEEVMRVADLSQHAAFRQALGGLQVRVREAVSGPIQDDRMPPVSAHRQGILHPTPDTPEVPAMKLGSVLLVEEGGSGSTTSKEGAGNA